MSCNFPQKTNKRRLGIFKKRLRVSFEFFKFPAHCRFRLSKRSDGRDRLLLLNFCLRRLPGLSSLRRCRSLPRLPADEHLLQLILRYGFERRAIKKRHHISGKNIFRAARVQFINQPVKLQIPFPLLLQPLRKDERIALIGKKVSNLRCRLSAFLPIQRERRRRSPD